MCTIEIQSFIQYQINQLNSDAVKMVNIKGNFKLGVAVAKCVLSRNTKGQNLPRVPEVKKIVI